MTFAAQAIGRKFSAALGFENEAAAKKAAQLINIPSGLLQPCARNGQT